MFIKLHTVSGSDDPELIMIRPEEIAAIESSKDDDPHRYESIVYLRGNPEPVYVTESQQEVYDSILKEEILRSIDKELTRAR